MTDYSDITNSGSQVNASQLDTSEVQRFDIDDPTWLAHLKDEGYVVTIFHLLFFILSTIKTNKVRSCFFLFVKQQCCVKQ